MNYIQSFIDAKRKLFALPENIPIFVETHAPERLSRLSRCSYKIRTGEEKVYRLIIQDSRTMDGHICLQNPFVPEFYKDIEYLLPQSRGCFYIENTKFYWSEYLHEKSLYECLYNNTKNQKAWDLLLQCGIEVNNYQEKHISTETNYFNQLIEIILVKTDDKKLASEFIKSTEYLRKWLPDNIKITCSWSHGDIWPKDIFSGNKIKIIDWEWALREAPLGVDIIDLYLTTAQHILNFSMFDSWISFINNSIIVLQPLYQVLLKTWHTHNFDDIIIRNILLYVLFRAWGREIAQDGYRGFSNKSAYLSLAEKIVKEKVFGTKGAGLVVYSREREENSEEYNLEDSISLYGENELAQMARKLLDEKNIEHANIVITKSLERFPNSINLLSLMAEIRIKSGDIQGGKRLLLELLKQSPDKIDSLVNLGVADMYEGNRESVVEILKYVLVLDPGNKTSLENLAIISRRISGA